MARTLNKRNPQLACGCDEFVGMDEGQRDRVVSGLAELDESLGKLKTLQDAVETVKQSVEVALASKVPAANEKPWSRCTSSTRKLPSPSTFSRFRRSGSSLVLRASFEKARSSDGLGQATSALFMVALTSVRPRIQTVSGVHV
jgi:hypothetical protein